MQVLRRVHSYLSGKQFSIFELFALFLIGIGIYAHDLENVEFWVDENPWIYESAALNSFLKGDFSSDLWENEYNGMLDPPVAKYLIGIGMNIGHQRPDSIPKWDWHKSSQFNIGAGGVPSKEILWWARIPMVATSIVGLLFAAVLVSKAHSRFAALSFYALSLTSFTVPLRQAMSEPALVFFTFLAALAGYKGIVSLSKENTQEAFLYFAVFGILSGFASGSKLNGIFNIVAGILSILIFLLWNKQAEIKRVVKLTTQLGLVQIYPAIFIFVAINPYLFHNPVQNAVLMFIARGMTMNVQKILYPSSLVRPEDWLRIVPDRIFAQYATPDYPANLAINIFLFAVGAYFVFQAVIKSIPGREANLVLTSFALTCALPALFSPFDWPRYYLFPVLFARIFIAIGLAAIVLDLGSITKYLQNMAGRFRRLGGLKDNSFDFVRNER